MTIRKPISLKDFSKAIGLSQTTVSRALNGYPEVNETTRRRIIEAADRFGYRANHAARGLATGRARAVGVVLQTAGGLPSDPHYMEFLTGVGEVAQERGYDILLSPSHGKSLEATYQRLAQCGKVDAMIVSSPSVNDPRIEWLTRFQMPFVVHGQSPDCPLSYDSLDIDNRAAFYEATRLLLNMGHHRIAAVNGLTGLTYAEHREAGVRDAIAEAGLDQSVAVHYRVEMTEREGDRIMRELLASATRPTAVICSSLLLALGCARAIYAHGLSIGRDISLVAHDDVIPFLKPESFRTPLTTTRSSIREAGRRIMQHLADRLEDGTTVAPTLKEVWPVDLVIRQSVGPAVMNRAAE